MRRLTAGSTARFLECARRDLNSQPSAPKAESGASDSCQIMLSSWCSAKVCGRGNTSRHQQASDELIQIRYRFNVLTNDQTTCRCRDYISSEKAGNTRSASSSDSPKSAIAC